MRSTGSSLPKSGFRKSPGRKAQADRFLLVASSLADRRVQDDLRHALSAITGVLGIIPVLMLASPAGPSGPIGGGLAIATTTCCLVMAGCWLRPRWPTRSQSAAFVLVATFCTAVACLVLQAPDAGFLGLIVFALLGAYATCFHPRWIHAFIWVVAASTFAVLEVRLFAVDGVLAVSGAVLVISTNVFVVVASRTSVQHLLQGQATVDNDIDPLTGLLNRQGLYARAAALLATYQSDADRYLVLTVLNIDGYSLVTSLAGERGADEAELQVGRLLRENLRHRALLAHTAEAEFVVADVCSTPGPFPTVERVRASLLNSAMGLTLSMGVVGTLVAPLRQFAVPDVLDAVIAVASKAMYDVRKTGGNAARYEINPRLAVAGGTDTPAS
ncbi:hypothetical protein MARA_01120 (plasmid) [Mycolicibacterium arabiense]|uniref:GGDEF domain-containing protein n=1 Tax=Mycolicibacterium arabiense TaxID=1286181 RepID=A0A7I7RQ26_9MYCO|nr:diguanylate cyclase [Mycolicibacterium arabiense]MCV7371997.1 diguanylate cyclase [Mycolicibacterium arabiense]BBY46682.1 hypothetical protein MARA_01120 [Mycolicibacterium arabiense]